MSECVYTRVASLRLTQHAFVGRKKETKSECAKSENTTVKVKVYVPVPS